MGLLETKTSLTRDKNQRAKPLFFSGFLKNPATHINKELAGFARFTDFRNVIYTTVVYE